MSTKTPEEKLSDSITSLELQTASDEYRAALIKNSKMKARAKAAAADELNQDDEYRALIRKNKIAAARDNLAVANAIAKDREHSRLQAQLAAVDAYNALSEAEKVKLEQPKQSQTKTDEQALAKAQTEAQAEAEQVVFNANTANTLQ